MVIIVDYKQWSYFKINVRNHWADTLKQRCSILFFLQLNLDATVTDNSFAADIPVLDENELPADIGDLSTIDTDTMARLCEEVQPAETSQVVQPTRVVTSA